MFRSIVLLVVGLALLGTTQASAENAAVGQKLGDGIHAYFSGDYAKAHEHLTAAIAGGSHDPRVFYFRGLAYLKLGRELEAVGDFKRGSTLESNDVNKFYDVPKALERVQGQGRVKLETYRADARMITMQQTEKARKARYEALRREEQRVLRDKPVTSPEAAKAAGDAPAAEPAETGADPFGEPAAEEKPTKKPAKANNEESPAAEEAGGGNPFGEAEEKKPAAKKTEKPKAEADNPFGGDAAEEKKPAAKGKADDANPFSDEPANDDKPAAKKPAAKEKPAADDNPFGGDEPAAEKKPAAKKAEKKTDSKKADADDPFAG